MSLHINRNKIISILGALALFLSLIEYVIPKPIPFLKIGIANIPIMISLILLTPKETIILICVKSVGASLIGGTIFSWVFLYSISGSLSSGLVMLLLKRVLKESVSMIGLGVAGALCSNLVQIYLATILLGSGAKFIGLPLLISGLITGSIIGHLTNKFISSSKWIRSILLN